MRCFHHASATVYPNTANWRTRCVLTGVVNQRPLNPPSRSGMRESDAAAAEPRDVLPHRCCRCGFFFLCDAGSKPFRTSSTMSSGIAGEWPSLQTGFSTKLFYFISDVQKENLTLHPPVILLPFHPATHKSIHPAGSSWWILQSFSWWLFVLKHQPQAEQNRQNQPDQPQELQSTTRG